MAGSKTPPRFVPTLTDVVHVPGDGRPPMAAQAAPVQPQAEAPASQVPPPSPSLQEGVAANVLPRDFEEYVVHRVMQRVDVALDQRLREAIAQVVQEQTRFLVPRLRDEVESVVRHAVYEAVAQELADERGAR
jgi:Arc/MetJ family transcription regulator